MGLPTLYTIKELADKFQVHYQTIRNWRNRGDLPMVKVNNRVYFKEEDVLKLLEGKNEVQHLQEES